jgi:hypothetical protein
LVNTLRLPGIGITRGRSTTVLGSSSSLWVFLVEPVLRLVPVELSVIRSTLGDWQVIHASTKLETRLA